jgi:sulfide:quinone oxidoreductase
MTVPASLNSHVWVCGQIAPDEVASLAATLGLRQIINNRPDHEEPGQPTSAEVRAATEAAGLNYLEAPLRGMPDTDITTRIGEYLAGSEPTLMFCRSGMRSAAAWAMAERQRGANADDLRATALAAGYDLSRLPL